MSTTPPTSLESRLFWVQTTIEIYREMYQLHFNLGNVLACASLAQAIESSREVLQLLKRDYQQACRQRELDALHSR